MCRDPNVKLSVDLWRAEVDILKTLDHSSIIKLLGYDASNLQLELEYVGQDLSTFMYTKSMSTLSLETAHQIWMDTSSGIEHIHSKNVFHFDIKPENVLLGQDSRAKIYDFGISIQSALQSVHRYGGTATYLPPEYRRNQILGRPAGIWACGLVMAFVLGMCPLPSSGK